MDKKVTDMIGPNIVWHKGQMTSTNLKHMESKQNNFQAIYV